MVKAYILVKCETGSIQSIVEEMTKFENVTEATAVTGEYDIIAKLNVEKVDELLKIVAGDIHSIPGVEDTTTCISTSP
ncbi:MAG: Lrp/AsnC ligand binding domain-containing protein [Halobacteria archaeon]|nr:Lrp/AsnC ligand binding domain-containing protein [Halobacteria archaeon]